MPRFHKRAFPDGTVERIPFTPEEEAARDAEEAAVVIEQAAAAVKETRRVEREARIKALAAQQNVTRAEQDELMNLWRERELNR